MQGLNRRSMVSLVTGVLDRGSPPGARPSVLRWVRTVNLVTIGCIAFNSGFIVFYAALGYEPLRPLIITNLIWNVGYALALWTSWRGSTETAVRLLVVTGWANTVTPAAILGVDTGVYLFLVLVPMVGVLVTGPRDHRLRFATVFVGVLTFAIVPVVFTRTPGVIRDTWVESVLFFFSAVGVGAFGSLFAWYYRSLVDRAEAALSAANERSERLLLNILPATVADRLKADESPIADRVDDVTVLFADLVGSTPLAERLEADALVALLDRIFSEFDDLADRHGLEKITSIGDGYMAVAGLPEPRADHIEAAARMSLDMRETLRACKGPGGVTLEMRLGLASGSVVAGVIGKRKFRYDVWGDTVNIASRMESHSLPGMIHVTADIQRSLSERYQFLPRGMVSIKGKGSMETYFLLGPRPHDSKGESEGHDRSALIPG